MLAERDGFEPWIAILPTARSETPVLARLLEAAPGLKYKAALSVAYGAGLSEVANLKVSDIDSQRMTLRVEQGKGQRDRHSHWRPMPLPPLYKYLDFVSAPKPDS